MTSCRPLGRVHIDKGTRAIDHLYNPPNLIILSFTFPAYSTWVGQIRSPFFPVKSMHHLGIVKVADSSIFVRDMLDLPSPTWKSVKPSLTFSTVLIFFWLQYTSLL